MKIQSFLAAAVLATASLSVHAEDPSMKEQMKDDWNEISQTASDAGKKTVEWGKSVGRNAADFGGKAADKAAELGHAAKVKANELTEQARAAAQKDPADESKPKPASKFFY